MRKASPKRKSSGISGRPRGFWLRVGVTAAAVLLSASPVPALDTDAHRTITLRALKGTADVDYVLTPTQKELVEFYRWFAYALAKGGDTGLQKSFRDRYPDPTDFHAVAIRQFLGLSMIASADIWGVTKMPANNAEQRNNLMAVASAYPITDKRAMDHVVVDDNGDPQLGPDKRPTPLDPQTLAHGPALGPGSDAWSHDALALGAPDAVTNVADPDPSWRQAGAAGDKPVNYAAQLCQTHLDMAVLARVWGDITDKVPAEQIATVWVGGAIHYAQDAALPTATAEWAGTEMAAAVSGAYRRDALTSLGGYVTALQSTTARAKRARRNLHLLAERWLHDQVGAYELRGDAHPVIKAAIEGMHQDDEDLRKVLMPLLRPWLNGARFTEPYAQGRGGGSVLVEAVAALSARDAPAMFDVLAELAAPGVASGAVELLEAKDVKSVHWAGAAAASNPAANDRLAALMARTIARAAISSRLVHAFWVNGSPDSAARRVQEGRLRHLENADKRVAAWQVGGGVVEDVVQDPLWAVVPPVGVAVLLLGAGSFLARRRRNNRHNKEEG